MVKFIKVNGIASHEVLIIPTKNMMQISTSDTTTTIVRYRTSNTDINILVITHAAMSSSSNTAMSDWVTKQFIAAGQQPWSQPMYNVQASDAPYLISNIQVN